MRLQGHNLSVNMLGSEIIVLHKELARLGYKVPLEESRKGQFGPETEQIIKDFQKKQGLAVTGIVDEKTATALNRAAAGQQPVVSDSSLVEGRITYDDGRPMVGVTVQAVDKALRSETVLVQATTNAEGNYELLYTNEQLQPANKKMADLVIRILNKTGGIIAQSSTRYNARPVESIDLTVSAHATGSPSRYERLKDVLQDVLPSPTGTPPSPLPNQFATLKQEEIEFVQRKTGMARPHLESLVAAAQLQLQAARQNISLPMEVFYGLLQEGLPADLTGLLTQHRRVHEQALTRAFLNNHVPRALENQLSGWLDQLHQLAIQHLLQTPRPGTVSSLSALLTLALPADKQRALLVDVYLQNEGSPETFWQGISSHPGLAPFAAKVQDLLRLDTFTQHHLPLVQALQGTGVSLRDLAKKDRQWWEEFLRRPGIGLPPSVPGQTSEEKLKTYANGILESFAAAFPTDAVARVVTSATYTDQTLRQAVSQIFANAVDLDLRHTHIDGYITEHRDSVFRNVPLAQQEPAIREMKRLQRLSRLSPQSTTLTRLLATNLDSAHKMASIPRRSFVSRYGPQLGGEQPAAQLHDQALRIAGINTLICARLFQGLNDIAPRMVGSLPEEIRALLERKKPTWAALFGPSHFCECRECRSVLSPAAYLVDLLHFLQQSNSNAQGLTPFDVLISRRPDLPHLKLTCENTNTSMPYVDLVNEILEYYVAFAALDGRAVQDTGDSSAAELNATPQGTNDEAYRKLQTCVYPFSLPYNQPLETAHLFLAQLGISRAELMRAFQRNGQPTNVDLACETLGISPEERDVLCNVNPRPLPELYGYASQLPVPQLVAQLKALPQLLYTTGAAYEDMVELLKTRFLNADQRLTLTTPAANPAYPEKAINSCDVRATTISALDVTALDRMHRFLRLQRKLPWTIHELDQIMTVRKATDITLTFLQDCGTLQQLLAALHLPLPQLLCFWSEIPVSGRTSLYLALFQSRAVHPQLDPVFTPRYVARLERIPPNGLTFPPAERERVAYNPQTQQLSFLGVMTESERTALREVWKDTDYHHAIDALFERRQHDFIGEHTAPCPGPLSISFPRLVHGEISYDAERRRLRLVGRMTDQERLQLLSLLPNNAGYQSALASLFEQTFLSNQSSSLQAALGINTPEVTLLIESLTETMMLDLERSKAVLTLANLSRLYRHASLAKSLHLSIQDLTTLLTLTGIDPFRDPAATIDFVEALRSIRQSGFSIAQLAYLCGVTSASTSSCAPPSLTAPRLVISLREGLLQAARSDSSPQMMSRDFIKQTLSDELKLDTTMTAFLVNQVLRVHRSSQPPPTSTNLSAPLPPQSGGSPFPALPQPPILLTAEALQETGLTIEYFPSVDLTGKPISSDVSAASYPPSNAPPPSGTRSVRWTGMLQAPVDGDYVFYLETMAGVRLWVSNQLLIDSPQNPAGTELRSQSLPLKAAELFSIRLELRNVDSSTTATLLWSRSDMPKTPVVADCLYPNGVVEAFVAAFHLLHKVALLINTLKLTVEEVAYLSRHPNDFAGLNLNLFQPGAENVQPSVLFKHWQRLCNLAVLRKSLPSQEIPLLHVFAAASAEKLLSEVSEMLVKATGWDEHVVEALIGSTGFSLSTQDFRNELWLLRLQQCVGILRQIGASAEHVFNWTNNALSSSEARNIRNVVKAKYDEGTWLTVAKPLNDTLRESQRAALTAYVLTRDAIKNAGITDANGLFQHFLIDVEMSAGMMTSRVKQAISSIQLFIQRCLMGSEPSVNSQAIDAVEWEWMQQYRVWEANRRIFLYPENWIDPELREDKSPFFKELESELLQNEITKDTVEQAFLHYLEKLDRVARLEICGMYWQDKDPETEEEVNILHVFGRTFHTPHVYYYRRLERGTTWTAWEKMDVDIEGDHLIPVIWNRRLYVFWPLFRERPYQPKQQEETSESNEAKGTYTELRLSWSEYKGNKWSAKQITPQTLILTYSPFPKSLAVPKEAFVFKARIDRDDNLLFQIYITLITSIAEPAYCGEYRFPSYPGQESRLYKASYYKNLNLSKVDLLTKPAPETDSWKICPPITCDPQEMTFMEKPSVSGQLTLRQGTLEGTLTVGDLGNVSDMKIFEQYTVPLPVLRGKPASLVGRYQLLYPHQFPQFVFQAPFFYQDDRRTYFVTPSWTPASSTSLFAVWVLRARFTNHFHPYVCEFIKILNRTGIAELLTTNTQRLDERPNPTETKLEDLAFHEYQPVQTNVAPSYPVDTIDFSDDGAYALYNWELFFHVPLLIATRLSREQRFEEARQWFHFIFDPTVDSSGELAPQCYWRFLPFKTSESQNIESLLDTLSRADSNQEKQNLILQLEEWRRNPFRPHRIAKFRYVAYQKYVIMKYIENLIAWGDHLFRQDTIESINQATQLYVLAAEILGSKPQRLPLQGRIEPETFATLSQDSQLDPFSNAMVAMENEFPFGNEVTVRPGTNGSAGLLGLMRMRF